MAVEYFFKAPEDIAERLVLVLHPMLATGNSAVAALDRLKEAGAQVDRASSVCWPRRKASTKCRRIIPTCISGPRRSTRNSTNAGYIVPGVGDVGDRMYGTK